MSQEVARLTAEVARLHEMSAEFNAIVSNLAKALFPDSPQNSAEAEFSIDAMGACQVIKRLKADSARLDWLESQHGYASYEPGSHQGFEYDPLPWRVENESETVDVWRETLRDAIDAAIALTTAP